MDYLAWQVLRIDLSDCVQVDDTSVMLLLQKLPAALKGAHAALALLAASSCVEVPRSS